ncbi:MAG: galactokinase [Lentisphaerae bacterium]|nr:MAG: galactokinase [Lentisphaerota bacterium]
MVGELQAQFRKCFGREPEVIARAPGRLEILGNHTDYNEGVTLSCAVDLGTYIAVAKCPGNQVELDDIKFPGRKRFSLSPLPEPEKGEWTNYIRGVIQAIRRRGHEIGAFQGLVTTELPLSSGMSSSAALEIAAAYALGELFGIELPPEEWAKVGQDAENNYVGANTGLLDQFSSIFGRTNQLVFTDFRSLEVRHCPTPEGISIIVANSGVKHDLTAEYNERRQSCEEAARLLGVKALRDVSMSDLQAAREELPDLVYRRALHVVGENERVYRAMEAMAKKDLETFGRLVDESHESSRTNFENSCPELDQLIEIGRTLPGYIGARLSGGGFGGISIHFVHSDKAQEYGQRLKTAFAKLSGQEDPQVMCCNIGQGAQILCSNR